MLAHIGGIPVEETALTVAPLTVLALSVGIALVKERAWRRNDKRRNATETQR